MGVLDTIAPVTVLVVESVVVLVVVVTSAVVVSPVVVPAEVDSMVVADGETVKTRWWLR